MKNDQSIRVFPHSLEKSFSIFLIFLREEILGQANGNHNKLFSTRMPHFSSQRVSVVVVVVVIREMTTNEQARIQRKRPIYKMYACSSIHFD